MVYEDRIRVQFRDVDAMQHVNNAVYFTWMETARTEYYLKARGIDRVEDVDIIVARATCEYKRGVRLGEEVVVRVWPSRVGSTSFDLSYELRVADEVVALGHTVLVSYDYSKRTKKPVPETLRATLERDLGDPAIESEVRAT